MHKLILVFLLLSISLFAEVITIAVAANVSYAMDELKSEFEKKHPDVKVRIVLGSSGKLTAQIRNGAPYGIFMSADMKYPQRLFKDNLALKQASVYAQGTLALFSLKAREFSLGIELLKDTSIQKIALANAKTAPYGAAAKQALEAAGLYKDLKTKFVYAESISQTLSYVFTAADIGIVAKASLYSKKMTNYKEKIHWISIEPSLYNPINQGVVLLKYSKNAQGYKAFYRFILSKDARQIFKKYGYTV
ncbi:MAG TPA: molybdate ABC transporter substrate-binding protein [Sulfurimonas sp.]|nr:molybdate ABC transporter substrate-binding protein [Sulfurimonas sp.]